MTGCQIIAKKLLTNTTKVDGVKKLVPIYVKKLITLFTT